MNISTREKLMQAFIMFAQRTGGQVHLRSLRDAFASIMPFMILAGFVTLINNVLLQPSGILSGVISAETLLSVQSIGDAIGNGTLQIITLLVAIAVSYHLSLNRGYKNVIGPILVTLSSMIVVTPIMAANFPELLPSGVDADKVIPISYIGASGLFVGILVGLLSTDIFIKLSKNKRLQINLSGNIPPAVIQSFNVLIPIMLVVLLF